MNRFPQTYIHGTPGRSTDWQQSRPAQSLLHPDHTLLDPVVYPAPKLISPVGLRCFIGESTSLHAVPLDRISFKVALGALRQSANPIAPQPEVSREALE
jgi:hypothetical protein